MSRLLWIVALTIVLVLPAGVPAAIPPPAGIPDLARMALQVADLPAGAKVERQGYVKTSDVAEYEREFKEGTVRVGRTRLLAAENDVTLMEDAGEAEFSFAQFRAVVATKKGRLALAKQILEASGETAELLDAKIVVGPPVSLGLGDQSLRVPVTLRTFIGDFRMVIAVVRVDRVLSTVFLMGGIRARPPASAAATLSGPVVQRIHDGLIPVSTVPPAISGTAQVGQTLTAAPGTWTNSPDSYAYQWQRCDAAGANCAAIAGATAATYVVAATEVGATIRVQVTAANAVGLAAATSPQTPVVAP